MKNWNLIGFGSAIVMALILFPSLQVLAMGVRDGGGGKGVLCGSNVESLDLYEARVKGLNILPTTGNLTGDLEKFGIFVANHFNEVPPTEEDRQGIVSWVEDEILSKFQDVTKGQRLPFTPDATLPKLKAGCSFVQVIVYENSGTVRRDKEYWDKMAPLEQAALSFHEILYARARSYGIGMSDETRAVVGELFTGVDSYPMFSPIWGVDPQWVCVGGKKGTSEEIFEVLAVNETRNGTDGVGLYFSGFKSVYQTSRTETFLPKISLDRLVVGNFSSTSVIVNKPVTGETFELSLSPANDPSMPPIEIRAVMSGESLPPPSKMFCSLVSH